MSDTGDIKHGGPSTGDEWAVYQCVDGCVHACAHQCEVFGWLYGHRSDLSSMRGAAGRVGLPCCTRE